MEELTTEQKAKAYDEAIKRIENIKTGKCETTFMFTEGLFEHIFPELKEDRDERIRKVLISYFKSFKEQEDCGLLSKVFYGIPTDDIRAWLEKQGADKPYYTDLLGYFEIGKRLNHSVEEIRNWLKSKI